MDAKELNGSVPQEQTGENLSGTTTASDVTATTAEALPLTADPADASEVIADTAGAAENTAGQEEPQPETPQEQEETSPVMVGEAATTRTDETITEKIEANEETASAMVEKEAHLRTEEIQPEATVAAEEASQPEEAVVQEKEEAGTTQEALTVDVRPETAEGVDFTDEEANLHAEAPKFDLGEENEEEKENNTDPAPAADFNSMTKTEIVEAFSRLLETVPVQNLRPYAESAKVAFYKVYRQSVENAKKEFVEAGNPEKEFVPAADHDEEHLKSLFNRYRQRRNEFVQSAEKQKEENYKVKLAVIEELKDLINKNETMNDTFKTFRELQQKWKETGPVPQAYVKDVWETYHLHVENFYSLIKIDRELRDLDLKKNAEEKTRLCEEAEALLLEPSIVSAFHKLQKLHELWRETGPVGNEYKEQLWERFREASSKINKRHQEHFESIKEEQRNNLDLKTKLCVQTEELGEKEYPSRKDWDEASEQLIEIQKVWKTIGFAPKKDNTRIYERFRQACDRFFEKKRGFYAGLKSQMEENLQARIAICEQAEALQDSTEWKKTTDQLIALRKQWKEIGSVSRKQSDAIWKRFRQACDTFFGNKSKHFSQVDGQYAENLEKKKALIEEIRGFEVTDRESSFEALKEFQRRWTEIGYVPIKQKDKIQAEYRDLIDAHFNTLRGNDKDRKIERFREKISGMKEGKRSSIRYERDRLYNKLKQMESDVQLLENNIGFFANSKNAESLIRDVQEKITRAKEEMQTIIDKIKLIDSQSEE